MDNSAGRADAQRRADRIRAFRAELDELEREGALPLTPEQREALRVHHDATLHELARRFDVDVTDRERQASWGMRIASTLGALALGTAVVLFFQHYWGLIPVWVQVVLLTATPIAGVFAAEWTARRERAPYFTSLVALVAFAAFALDLNVLGSVFNLTPTPNALLAWAVFAVALAYRHGLRLVLAVGLVCGGGWLAATLLLLSGAWWAEVFSRPETILAAGLLLSAAPRRAAFASTHRLVGFGGALVAAFILSLGGATFLPLDRKDAEKLYQLVGMAGGAAAIWFGTRRNWKETVNLGAAAFLIFLYIRLAEWWWDWMPKYLFFLLVGLISVGLLLAFRFVRGRAREAGV
jgi:uncharacterized membrane protein